MRMQNTSEKNDTSFSLVHLAAQNEENGANKRGVLVVLPFVFLAVFLTTSRDVANLLSSRLNFFQTFSAKFD